MLAVHPVTCIHWSVQMYHACT